MRQICLVLIGGIAAVLATSAGSRREPDAHRHAGRVQSLLACRAIADSAQRLACYDRAGGDLADAMTRKELVICRQGRANEAKRSLFGFSMPNFSRLLGAATSSQPDRGHLTALHTTPMAAGDQARRRFDLDADRRAARRNSAAAGRQGVVKRGTLGSYFFRWMRSRDLRSKRIG